MGWDILQVLASTAEPDLEASLASWSIRVVSVTSLLVIMLLLYASRQKRMKNKKKKTLFLSLTSLILASTIFLFGTTIYINSISDSKGPVHWHTDIEFWVCDTEIELREPSGALSNKIGSPTYHEHNDKRIHLEGVVVDKDYDASLEKFMVVTKGLITDTQLVIPTNQEYVETDPDGDPTADSIGIKKYHKELETGWVIDVTDGHLCGSEPAETQAFVISYNKDNDTYAQTKLADPKSYIMRDESVVPPGDCVIVEFAPTKNRTDKLCLQYGIRDTTRCAVFSGKEKNDKLCTIYEVFEPATTGGAQ